MLSYLWGMLDPGFLAPAWLLVGFFAMAALAALEVRSYRLRQRAVRAFAASHLVAALAANVSQPRRVLKALLIIAALGLLCFALARPYLFYDWTDEKRSGIDVMLAVDCSKSMLTQDVHPSRLERAKLAIADFADYLPADRLGLIAFAGDAFLECPLTLDHDAFLDAVRDLDTDTIPKPGTDVATAIDEASDALQSQPANMKFLILVSDGEDLEGRVLTAAHQAAQNGLKIFTVGVGTPEGDRILERDDSGIFTYHRDQNGNDVISHLDENTLRQIADITGGAYEPLGQEGDGLEQIYRRYIAPLPMQELGERRQKIHIERFEWPLGAAILFLMAEFLINDRARSRETLAPEPPPRHVRRRAAAKSVAAVAATVLALPGFAGSSALRAAELGDAQRAYQAGDYDTSMEDYEKAAQSDPAHPELQFNRGDAAYKAGEFSEAEEAFHAALATRDLSLQEQTYYNLGNTQYEHGAALRSVDTKRTIQLWRAALHSYECALKLKTAADTQHNYEVVKRKLEELQQQPQQGGDQPSSDSGQGKSGPNGQQSGQGQTEAGASQGGAGNQGQSNGEQNGADSPNGANGNQASRSPGTGQGKVQAYSGTRGQDLKDPQIRSRQEAENLLDSLAGEQKRISARSLSSDGENQPPPSGKDW
jgi:Ca-activated chloride channel family protein